MADNKDGVSLWVKAEPFSYGAFHIAPHPRLNFNVSDILMILASHVINLFGLDIYLFFIRTCLLSEQMPYKEQ